MVFSNIDIFFFVLYCLAVLGIGIRFSLKSKYSANAENYFLASKSLSFPIIGCSILAANISAEQFIGMSGSAYAIGLAIAGYEWISAIVLILVAKFFLPVFIREKIYTMPSFLARRYNARIQNILSVFWLFLFVFVNLTSILYLGALALSEFLNIHLMAAILFLALFSASYTIFGGLKAIAKIDVIHVVFLILGGLLTTYFSLNHAGNGQGAWIGFHALLREAPDKFVMILEKDNPNFTYLPGIRAVFGGIWIAAVYYFGANQYIIQKALGAKSLKEAQNGMVFAGFLKILTPLVVVIPGIAAFVLNGSITKPDEAYPWLLNNFVPAGIKGIVFAALIAAIVSSLSAIINSASTIFTMDIYKKWFNKTADDKSQIRAGRAAVIIFTLIAAAIAPLLGSIDQVFQFIQKYTGFISPAITSIFILGIFSRKTTSNAALWGIIINILLAMILEIGFPHLPFLDKMLVLFAFVSLFIICFSRIEKNTEKNNSPFYLKKSIFKTSFPFNISSIILIGIVIFLYIMF